MHKYLFMVVVGVESNLGIIQIPKLSTQAFLSPHVVAPSEDYIHIVYIIAVATTSLTQ